MKTQLTMELLRRFLGGQIEINSPNYRYWGLPGEVCLEPKDVARDRIRWIGIRFRWIMEMINEKPVGRTKLPDRVLEFNLRGKTHIGVSGKNKKECLIIPTDLPGEEIKFIVMK